MTEADGGWDDLFEDPAPATPPMRERVDWADVQASLAPVAPDRLEQPETGADAQEEMSDALTLFGSPDQFHVAWQHWNGMPEFHMDDLSPDSTLVVKFRTPEDREAFAQLIGRTIRKEESRGIWYPGIVIAHFWDKRYRDETAETTDNTPILSEAEEVDDEEITEETPQ
jgi:hypothetical protein